MGNLSIIVKQIHISFLNQFVRDNDPFESCAILLGKRQEDEFIIEEIVPAQNKDSSIIRFTIENDRLYEIYKIADEKKLSVIGIFHSHPSDPYPSDTDKFYMNVNPVPWIIKSTITNEMRCFISGDQANGDEPLIAEIKIEIKG
jgi:proteasome lid subunit RPN8/RPN11